MTKSDLHVITNPLPTPLAEALDQSQTVQSDLVKSAAELMLVHAVLKQELPENIQTGEVAEALQKADDLETKISDTAEDLAQVNDVLEQEIVARADLQSELAAAKTALAREKAKL